MGEFEPEDLGFVFVELETGFGSFSGFGIWVGSGPADGGSEAVGVGGGGCDVVWVDVGVEAVEEEGGDVEEREECVETKRECGLEEEVVVGG